MLPYPYIRSTRRKQKRDKTYTQSPSLREAEKIIRIDQSESEKLIEQGRKEAIKELAKNEIEELPKTKELAELKDRELMRIKTVFPFVLFPDYLVIEENKLTFIWSLFFLSKDIRSILIKDISNVTVETGVFFAKINVVDQYFSKAPLSITYLPKEKALEARRLIQGLIVSVRENIDFHSVSQEKVIEYAMRLGEADTRQM